MNGFNKFKKKIMLEHIIRALLICVSLFSLVSGILSLLNILEVIDLNVWICLLIGLAAGLALSIPYYFIFKPSDMKIAKRLDSELGLEAKMETMIEYKDSDNQFHMLQREDANKTIDAKSTKLLKLSIGLALIIVSSVLLVAGLSTSGVALKLELSKNDIQSDLTVDSSTEDDNKEDSVTVQKLKLLIEMVENSNVSDSLKIKSEDIRDLVSYVDVLYCLIDDINTIDNNVSMTPNERLLVLQKVALARISDLNSSLDYENISNDISVAFLKSSHPSVKDFSIALGETDTSLLNDAIVNLQFVLTHPSTETQGPGSDTQTKKTIEDCISEFVGQLSYYLKQVNDNDKLLYKTINDLGKELNDQKNPTVDDVNNIIAKYRQSLMNALNQEKTNLDIFNLLKKEIKKIFSIQDEASQDDSDSNDDLDLYFPESSGGDSFDSDEDGQKKDQGGGAGSGEITYSGNDKVYDPITDTYVSYGQIIAEYYEVIYSMIKDGTISEEDAKYLIEYFSNLYSEKK